MTSNSTNAEEHKGVNSKLTPLWESPICTTVLGLAFVVVLLSLSGLLSAVSQDKIFYIIIPFLLVISIALIALLLKQVRHNFLYHLNNLRRWSEEMLDDIHSARISIK